MDGSSLFKKRFIGNFRWIRMVYGAVVERVLMNFVLSLRRVVGRLLDVRVVREKGESCQTIYWYKEGKEWGRGGEGTK